ncbi:hypothetical protein [uncultured Aquimarina sp.]|uniref:hypothetical protein n=1 Tax=uncultured Aquimarina sp. TaxID=575652 RepID=UPI002613D36D|nr:hypothetical protein [uncultured Aquimarina sp.]
MSSFTADTFQSFLKDSIGDEVLIINTNIGMEVYYYSTTDYSNFIKENALLYILKHIDAKKLKFRNSIDKEEVQKSFTEAIITFAQYPQLFLAYTKKFIRLRDKNAQSQYVMPILNTFFENTMKLLAETGKVPHSEKIQKAKNKSQKSDYNQSIIDDLISEILLKKHSN